MDKRVVIIIVIVVTAAALFFSFENKENEVCFGDKCLEVEIVDTPSTRAQGLMFRESLGENQGMLFIFEENGNYPFWMKNTLIPLDIIWIDEELKILHIAEAEPCEEDPCGNYGPGNNALYVFETNKGFAREHGINVGDFIMLKLI